MISWVALASASMMLNKVIFLLAIEILPFHREFPTDESARLVVRYLPAIFDLSEAELNFVAKARLGERASARGYDYHLGAYSRVMVDLRDLGPNVREYVAKNFARIRYPFLKVMCAVILFSEDVVTPEILQYLRQALASEEGTKELAGVIGPDFEEFRRKVLTYPKEKVKPR
jgi:hypothetical protein